MRIQKNELIRFGIWTRNGIAFCTTWFLILLLVYNRIFHISTVRTNSLIRLFLWIVGGVLLFNSIFTRLFLKKWGFTGRLTCFMCIISLYDCLGFYWLGFFRESGTIIQWTAFIGIVLVLYLICIVIYQKYTKKRGEIYTRKLREYQSKRSMRHER